jgi:nucleoside-triphosphatase
LAGCHPREELVIAPKIFLTGDPGCGKTTVLRRVVERLRGSVRMTGFLTEEVREGARRSGFCGITLDGREFPLARVGGHGPYRIGPYTVSLEELDAIGVPALAPPPGTELVVLDEVGKMESFSAAFRDAVLSLLAREVPLLATVAVHGVGFPKKVRHDPRIVLVRMGRESRNAVVGELLRLLADAGIGAGTGRSRAATVPGVPARAR